MKDISIKEFYNSVSKNSVNINICISTFIEVLNNFSELVK